MAASLGHVLSQIERWTSPRLGELSDAVLLERFRQGRDESAFAAIVGRHGAMVLRSCRRILGDVADVADVEDAFQATFVILARKASALKQPDALAGWLHGVARRVALKTRTRALARAGDRPLAEELPDARFDPLARLSARELLMVLDEEVSRLPHSQQSAVLLCCLEGRTQEEAAKLLGWTAGSLKGHLERGRRRLHDRLRRRGIALPAALALVAVARDQVRARIPALMLQGAVRAALDGSVGGSASALAHGVLQAMFVSKLAGVLSVVLTVALIATTTVALVNRAPTAKTPEDKSPVAALPSKAPEKAAPRVDRFADPLPEGALLRLGTVRYRAGASINHAALSPDGKLLATACESGITFFDLATGKPRHLRESGVPNGFDSIGSPLAFSADGKQFVNVTRRGNLRFWDVATGKRLRVVGDGAKPGAAPLGGQAVPLNPVPVGSSRFGKVWFPRGGRNVIAGTHDNFAVLIDPSTGKTRRRFQLAGVLASVASDGKTLAVINAKGAEVILYDDTGKELRRFRHKGKIYPATLCQEGKRLVTVNDKAEIKIWDAATGKEQRTIAGPAEKSAAGKPTVVSIAPNGNTLFVGTRRGDILRWDLRDGKEQSPLLGHAGWVTGLFYTPDGRSLVSVSWDNAIHRWNLAIGKKLSTGEGYIGSVRVARSPDGRRIAAASYPGRLEFWDARAGKRLRVFSLPTDWVSKMRFSPDGKRLALACSDARVRLWDVDKESVTRELKLPVARPRGARGHSWFEGLAWSPNGRFLVTSMDGDPVRMWETATGKEIWQQARQGAVAFSPDGKTLVSGGWDKSLTFQDAATGAVRFTLKDDKDVIDDIDFSPDGTVLATCHHGGNVYLRDPKTGVVRKTLKAHREVAWSISFSPDSKWLASSGGRTVRVWEIATGTEILCRKGHEGRAYQAEFGPNSRTVLSSSWDLTALLWDIRPSGQRMPKRPLNALWTDLASEPAKAYRAVWALADDPKAASEFLRKKIKPVQIDVDERRVRALLADLDSDDFAKRELASRALAAMGEAVEDRLRRALADTRSAEVQRRLRGLLNDLKREPTAEDLRRMRAVQVMELCATDDAQGVLRAWASGTAGTPLTNDAKAALERLARRR